MSKWGRRYGNPDGNQGPIVEQVRSLPASYEITTGVGHGFPDGVVGFQGITVLAELKVPKKGRRAEQQLRESQDDFRSRWMGGPLLTVDNGMDLVQQLISLDVRTPPTGPRGSGTFKLTFPNGRMLEAVSLVEMLTLLTKGAGG